MNEANPPITSDDIRREEADDHGRYAWPLSEGAEAELTYRVLNAGTVSFDHTFVPPSHRHHGIAERLVTRAIEDARAAGLKVVPVCPYVAALFERHAEWGDVRARKL